MPIQFKNYGTLPLAAIKTFGVSVKSEGAIGFFGTGLKYALAILLRNNFTVSAYIEGKRINFITQTEDIRGTLFDIVCMVEEGDVVTPMGFTTLLGKTWAPWMAFRELYCNTLDEAGFTSWVDDIDTEVDVSETVFIVDGTQAGQMWDERHTVMLTSRPIVAGDQVSAHVGNGAHLYYKGIRVMDHRKPAKYNYDIFGKNIDLTEDRTVKYTFEARYAIAQMVMKSTDTDFIEKVVAHCQGWYEEDINYLEVGIDASEEFLDVVGKLRQDGGPLNITAIEYHREHRTKHLTPKESLRMTPVEEKQLARSMEVVVDMGYELYPIVVVDYLGKDVLGRAENGHIYLSKRAFSQGTKMLAGTLFEEQIHLAENLQDETRSMQNYIIDKLMSIYEEKIGEPI